MMEEALLFFGIIWGTNDNIIMILIFIKIISRIIILITKVVFHYTF